MAYSSIEDKRAAERRYSKSPKGREVARARRWRALYGMTPERYAELLNRQGGACAICEQPETSISANGGQPMMLAVDHGHGDERIRGLLCRACNQGIGQFRDDPDRLEAAAAYLRRPLG